MNKYFYLTLLLLVTAVPADAQFLRPASMGHLSISISDSDQELNLFDYSGNPAWFTVDQTSDQLLFTPSYSNNWGSYRRPFSAEGTNTVQGGFTGVKYLGSSGTFLGSAKYIYDFRRSYNRTLLKNTYNGDPFYFTDTTAADFAYKGPVFQFMHSIAIAKNLFAGASVNYSISNGNKKLYSYAETIYRTVNGKIGLAYSPYDNLVIGADYSIDDMQEKIDVADINNFTIESYHFRGDKYPIPDFAKSIKHKVKQSGQRAGLQLFCSPAADLKIIATGSYMVSESKVFVPTVYLIENEEGFSSLESYSADIASQYAVSDRLLLGVKASYASSNEWSKSSSINSKLWDWEVKKAEITAGGSYRIAPNFLIGAEYTFSNTDFDSSKYIDHKFVSNTSGGQYIKAGAEYGIGEYLFVRAGYNYGTAEYDLLYGGKDVDLSMYDMGIEYVVAGKMSVGGQIEYLELKEKDSSRKRYDLSYSLVLRLFTF